VNSLKFQNLSFLSINGGNLSGKIREFTLVIIFGIPLKNDSLGFKMKILKFLGIQPTYKSDLGDELGFGEF